MIKYFYRFYVAFLCIFCAEMMCKRFVNIKLYVSQYSRHTHCALGIDLCYGCGLCFWQSETLLVFALFLIHHPVSNIPSIHDASIKSIVVFTMQLNMFSW